MPSHTVQVVIYWGYQLPFLVILSCAVCALWFMLLCLCNHRGRWLTGRRWCGAWVAPLLRQRLVYRRCYGPSLWQNGQLPITIYFRVLNALIPYFHVVIRQCVVWNVVARKEGYIDKAKCVLLSTNRCDLTHRPISRLGKSYRFGVVLRCNQRELYVHIGAKTAQVFECYVPVCS